VSKPRRYHLLFGLRLYPWRRPWKLSSWKRGRRLLAAGREPRFNKVPADIVEVGFVEVPQLFSAKTCSTLLQLADRPAAKSAKPISNALQLDVKGRAELLVARAVRDSAVVKNTMLAVYQTEHFMVENVKILFVKPGVQAPPQIPHADDSCNARGLFGIFHLKPGQAPTECADYKPRAVYPLKVLIHDDPPKVLKEKCTVCKRRVVVPDQIARRRDFSTLTCEAVGEACRSPERDDTAIQAAVCAQLRSAFGQLLKPAAVIDGMRPCGRTDTAAGGGLLAMPTLVHRGPGTLRSAEGRSVLFFTIRPRFYGKRSLVNVGLYDADRQIHGAWLLWKLRKHGQISKKECERVERKYKARGLPLTAHENDE